jgi:hypothetical protein
VIQYDDTGLSAAQAAAVAGEVCLHEMLVAGQKCYLLRRDSMDGGPYKANVNWLKNIFQETNEG